MSRTERHSLHKLVGEIAFECVAVSVRVSLRREYEARHLTPLCASGVDDVGVVFATEDKRHNLGQDGCCLVHLGELLKKT